MAATSILLVGLAVVSAGPMARPAAAANPVDYAAHGLGSNPTPGLTPGISAAARDLIKSQSTSLPASVDLSEWTPPVGNQSYIGSCASWSTGYYYRYWLRNHALGETDTFAPMYLYSQLSNGDYNSGTTFGQNFNILETQGIAHAADYSHAWDMDYSDLPTAADQAAAAPYMTTSHTLLYGYAGGTGTEVQMAIEASLASGLPALLRIPVYDSFYLVSSTDPLVDVPATGETLHGYHAVFAPKYDATGVWIENSWGTTWGQNGWAELSWDFVNQYSTEGWNMTADAGSGWSVTLHASATKVNPGDGVTLTAEANQDVTVTPYFIVILQDGSLVVNGCGIGTTCSATVTFSATASHVFTAVVGSSTGALPRATSDPVTVTWGTVAATHLSVGTFNPYPAGVSHSVTVKALDAYGNTATGYTGSIHFTTSDTHATLPADYTFTSADKGVHTFTGGLTLKTAGSRWVRATDKTTASITGSQTVTVTPGVAKTLSVGTFNPYPAGVSHSVTVKALDAYGNVATGYTGSIHFTSSDTHATVPADYTFTSADKGVHTFTGGLTLKTAGSRWVRATDKTTASITGSQTVTVTS